MSAVLYFLQLKSIIKEIMKLKPASHHYACGLRAPAYCLLCSSLAATGVVPIKLKWYPGDLEAGCGCCVCSINTEKLICSAGRRHCLLLIIILCCWTSFLVVARRLLQSCCHGIMYKHEKIVKIQTQKYFRLDFLRFSLFTNIWLIPCCTRDIY